METTIDNRDEVPASLKGSAARESWRAALYGYCAQRGPSAQRAPTTKCCPQSPRIGLKNGLANRALRFWGTKRAAPPWSWESARSGHASTLLRRARAKRTH